jgi:tetratricopeptide (TPR) repeat protein
MRIRTVLVGSAIAVMGLLPVLAGAQVGQLKQGVWSARNPAERLKAILALCADPEALPKDTLYHYALEARQLAQAAEDVRYASYYLAFGYYRMNKLDSAELILRPELPKLSSPASVSTLDILYRFLWARYNLRRQDYKTALPEYYRLLTLGEQRKDTLTQARALAGIGSVLNRTGDRRGALQSFLDGIQARTGDALSR